MNVDLGQKYKDSILPDEVTDWLRSPKTFKEHVKVLRDHAPHLDVIKKADKTGPTAMDQYYHKWFKVTKTRKGVKKRPMAMVKDNDLKRYHRTIYNILKLPYHKQVYSYEKGRSAADCAAPHTNKFAIFEIDIRGFFPSFTRSIIEQGYYEWLHTMSQKLPMIHRVSDSAISKLSKRLSIVCTASNFENPQCIEAVLPIGIEPSVIISNSFPIELDNTLYDFCSSRRLTYSRYSDNIFVSRTTGHIPRSMQEDIKGIVNDFELHGVKPFKVNDGKERYIPYWRRQRILGAVVNEKVNVSKSREIWLRSALNHLYYDCLKLIDSIKNEGKMSEEAVKSSSKLYRRYRKVMGNHSYFCAINKEKYLKYSTQVIAVKILIDEIMYLRGTISQDLPEPKESKAGTTSRITVKPF